MPLSWSPGISLKDDIVYTQCHTQMVHLQFLMGKITKTSASLDVTVVKNYFYFKANVITRILASICPLYTKVRKAHPL